MKNLLTTLVIGLFAFGLANCGSSGGGGGGEAPAPATGLGGDASTIVIDDGSNAGPIEWASNYNNIYFNVSTNGNCVTGLAQSADDETLDAALSELQTLLNAATVQAGTGEDFASNENAMPRVIIDGEIYYLVDRSETPATANTLSNVDDILAFYDDMYNQLSSNGVRYCPGKGDTLNSNGND